MKKKQTVKIVKKGLKRTTVYSQNALEMFKKKMENYRQFVSTFCGIVTTPEVPSSGENGYLNSFLASFR